MAKALWHTPAKGKPAAAKSRDWKKRISDHLAAALLVYTGLHIFVTMKRLGGDNGSILPYFALVFLVAAVIPACRLFEKRWEELAASDVPPDELRRTGIRDLAFLWAAAFGLPLLVTGVVAGLLALI